MTDSEIKSYTVAPSDVGNWAPYVPNTTFNTGIQYSFLVSSNVETTFRVDYEIRGKQYWDTANTTARSSLNLVNLRFGIRAIDDDWSLIAWSKNATDEEYNAEFVSGGFASIAPPNTFGIDFTKRF
jgi:iron complex outermembrane receptor protein